MQKVIPLQVGYTATGEYMVAARTGTMAANLAADSEIYQFRNSVTGLVCIVTEVSLWAIADSTGFTAGSWLFRLVPARAWTVAGTGGGTPTITGGEGKLNQLHVDPRAGAGAIRVATTAALGAGTKTADANGLYDIAGSIGTSAFTSLVSPAAKLIGLDAARYPLVLAANQGFSVRATVPATGTWIAGITVRWEETGGFPR